MKVGVIAVDPTSPFSGGAVLGDRVRMNAHAADRRVHSSMATRGHLGGLARATSGAALVLDAAGYEVVIIETVGVGQDEVDIVSAADISIVLLVPGAGDDLQAIKAGVMEIGDIFVVNKADREGADRVVQGVASNLALKTYDPPNGNRRFSKPRRRLEPGRDLWRRSAGSESGPHNIVRSAVDNDTCRGCAMLASSFCGTSTAFSRQRLRSLRRSRRQPGPRSILSG